MAGDPRRPDGWHPPATYREEVEFGVDPREFVGIGLYLVVWTIVFVESGLLVGFLLPGDTLLFAAGLAVADERTGTSLPVLVTGVVIAAIVGDAVGYAIGRRGGRPFLERRQGKLLNRDNLRRAEQFYARYGGPSVVAARFVPWVRTLVPVLAGASLMPYRQFVVWNVAGAVVWGAGLCTVGYLAATTPGLRHAAYAVAVVSVVLSFLAPAVRRLARRHARPAAGAD